MAAIKPQQAAAFLRSPPADLIAVLFHGTDPGLVGERAAAIAKTLAARADPPGEILRIDESDLDGDPDRLAVELGTIPMFGGRKIVRSAMGRRLNAALVKPLIEEGRIEGVLVLEAGNLRADDGLRKLFEAAPRCAALACYPDEARDLDALVSEILKAEKIEIAEDARKLLTARLGADRALSRAEIEKLALYAHGRPRIEIADVDAVVGDASELAVDRVLQAALSGDAGAAVVECERSVASGESPQFVLVMLLRQVMRLHRVRAAMDDGASAEEALRGLRPPLFFKQRDEFLGALKVWPAARLETAIGRIDAAMRSTRGGEMEEAVVTERLLLEIAHLAAIGRPPSRAS